MFYNGTRRFLVQITSDQPKGLYGVMSRVEDKGNGWAVGPALQDLCGSTAECVMCVESFEYALSAGGIG